MVTIKQCRVCTSPHRREAETLLLDGVPPIEVVRRMPQMSVAVTSIRRHVRRRHLPVDVEQLVGYLSERKDELDRELVGKATAAAKRDIDRALLTLVAGQLRLKDGSLTVTAADCFDAVRFIDSVDGDARKFAVAKGRADALDRESIEGVDQLCRIIENVLGPDALGAVLDTAYHTDRAGDLLMHERLFWLRDYHGRIS